MRKIGEDNKIIGYPYDLLSVSWKTAHGNTHSNKRLHNRLTETKPFKHEYLR